MPKSSVILVVDLTPRVLEDLLDIVSLLHVPVQHAADEIDTLLANHKGNPQVAVHYLVDAVERVLLIDNGVQQDTESPHILFFAAIRVAGKDLGCCVIYELEVLGTSCLVA